MRTVKTAVVGATGLVGRTMVKVLEEREFPVESLRLFASGRSAGQVIKFRGENLTVEKLTENSFEGIEIALFSAGKEVSLKYAPVAARSGCIVVDNSSAWRMDKEIPLVVPEVNPNALEDHPGIIANPNCSTIQMVVALKPVNDNYKLSRVIVSTYQSISGAGQKGVNKLTNEINGNPGNDRHRIAYNALFHTITDDSGFSEEEIKMINETRKIMELPDLKLAVTCVRLPVLGGHGESLNIETEKPFEISSLRELLSNEQGIVLVDGPQNEDYPTMQLSEGKDPVFVGRLRKDDTVPNGAYMWVVADNLRKGAATNAVQIAELIVKRNLFDFKPVK